MGKRLTLQHAKDRAAEKGGFCLSEDYINNQTKMLWQCGKCFNTWEAIYGSVYSGHWCPTCGGSQKLTLQHAKDLAIKYGGLCLSKEYINTSTKMLWQCAKGHSWGATYNKVYSGSWCPTCASNTSYGEILSRLTLEQMLGCPFPKTRNLPWLVTPEGNHLELDCYNEELKLALEYNGEQHYLVVPYYFNTDTKSLEALQARDRLKRRLCAENGVLLLQVDHTWGLSEIPKVIFNLLVSFGFLSKIKPEEVDVDSVYAWGGGGYSKDQLISDIKTFVDLFGVPPTQLTWDQYYRGCGGSVVGVATYQKYFGSWSSAIASSGYTPRKRGPEVKYTIDDLLKPLVAYVKENRHLPQRREWEDYARTRGLPSASTYAARFSSWSSALSLAQDQLNKEKNLNSP